MNQERRKRLQNIAAKLDDLKSVLEDIHFEEEKYRDNIPENLRRCNRYYAAEEVICNIESAVTGIEDVCFYIKEAIRK